VAPGADTVWAVKPPWRRLSNVPPALAILLIAFAYLEEDGALLGAALAAALAMLAVASLAVWEAVSATGWVPGIL
jgi:hypothetical protein